MPIVLAALCLIAGIALYVTRGRSPATVAADGVNAADMPGAVRCHDFRSQANRHPVESIEHPEIAIAGLAVAVLQLDGMLARDHPSRLGAALRAEFGITTPEADALIVCARRMVRQCGTGDAAINRLSRRLYKISGPAAVAPLLAVVQNTLANSTALTDRQRGALHDVSRALRVR